MGRQKDRPHFTKWFVCCELSHSKIRGSIVISSILKGSMEKEIIYIIYCLSDFSNLGFKLVVVEWLPVIIVNVFINDGNLYRLRLR